MKLAQALVELALHFNEAGCLFAVVGGIAASVRGEPSVEQEAKGRLSTARLRSARGVVCDLIFATTGIEAKIVNTASLNNAPKTS